ncbi:MAG: biopolymer transporter ExbD [Planctomycetota bacterium]
MRVPESGRRIRSHRINMTPMIDVVMLLIIFFLVSSHLARREVRYPVDLAAADTAAMIDPMDGSIPITIDAERQIRFGGEIVTLEQLATRVTMKQQRSSTADPIRLRIDRSVPFETVQPLLRQLSAVGVDSISIATQGK